MVKKSAGFLQNEKCVMVIDKNPPPGIIVNPAAIMGITLGKQMPGVTTESKPPVWSGGFDSAEAYAFLISR